MLSREASCSGLLFSFFHVCQDDGALDVFVSTLTGDPGRRPKELVPSLRPGVRLCRGGNGFSVPPPPRRISAQAVHGSSHIGLWENTNSSEVYHEISRFSADFATICPFVYHQGTIVPTTFKVGLKRCCSPPGVAIFPLRGLSFRACQATTSRGRV